MDEDCIETDTFGSQPCTPQAFNPMLPSTSRVPTPARPSSTMSARQYGSPFRVQPQNMEPSNSRVQELRDAAAGKKSYTSDWMQSSYLPPTGQPQQYQRAPSMVGSTVSNMSNTSQMSQMTTFSVLSVNTKCGEFDQWIYQAPPALSRVSMSSMENHDPMKRRERMSIPEICDNLRSREVNAQVAAIRELEPVAKAHQLELTYGKGDLQQIIEALFERLMPREDVNETKHDENIVRKVCEILHHALMLPARQSRNTDRIFLDLNEKLMMGATKFQRSKSCSIYEIVILRATKVDTVYESSAMVLMTHLCCKMYLLKRVFAQEKISEPIRGLHQTVVNFLICVLNQKTTNEKKKGFAVSIIKNLSLRNPTIRAMAVNLGIIKIFYEIMTDIHSDEPLLWPTMQALTAFCSDSNTGNAFVSLHGAQALCGLLSHGSTRLLYELLGCMRKLADLPALQNEDMKESILNIIQLVGSDDAIIVERATGTLRNIGLHNKRNKVYMVELDVIKNVLTVLRTSGRFTSQPTPSMGATTQQTLSSIYENCLSILNNVTLMAPQDDKMSALNACRLITEHAHSADILLHYFNIGTRKYRKLAVTVIKRVIEADPKFAEPFVDLRGTSNEPLPILLLKRTFESLNKLAGAQADVINSRFAPETPQRRELDERQKDHEDIVKRSVGLLTNLCTKGNPRFFEIVRDVLIDERNGVNLLATLQRHKNVMHGNVLYEWLEFIFAICSNPWSMQNNLLWWFCQDPETAMGLFKEIHKQPNPKIQEKIMQIYNIYNQQHQQRQQQMYIAQQQQQQMYMAQQQHQQNPM